MTLKDKLLKVGQDKRVLYIYHCGDGWVVGCKRPGGDISYGGMIIEEAIDDFLDNYGDNLVEYFNVDKDWDL
jgi:hypothetical protein